MTKGNIIFLNGTSSSGKTVIAKALQQILDEPYLHYSVDSFLDMLPCKSSSQDELSEEDVKAFKTLLPKIVSGAHQGIATFASEGINMVVDHVLQDPHWLKECVNLLGDFPVLFVGVRCPLKELERRERGRAREQGTARWQFDRVHVHGIYDIEIDTSTRSPMDCALQIKDALKDIRSSDAFGQLRQRLA